MMLRIIHGKLRRSTSIKTECTPLSAVLIRALPFALRVKLVNKRASTASEIPRTISTREHVSAEMDLFYGPQFHVI
jgi:hypothetical protein